MRQKLRSTSTQARSGIPHGSGSSICFSQLSNTELEEYLRDSPAPSPLPDDNDDDSSSEACPSSSKSQWMFEPSESARCSAFNMQVRFMRALNNVTPDSEASSDKVVNLNLLDRHLCFTFTKIHRLNQQLEVLPLVGPLKEKVAVVTSCISHLLSHLPLPRGSDEDDVATMTEQSFGGAAYNAGWKIKELYSLLVSIDSSKLPSYFRAELNQVTKNTGKALDFGIVGVRNVTVDHTRRSTSNRLLKSPDLEMLDFDIDLDDFLSSSNDEDSEMDNAVTSGDVAGTSGQSKRSSLAEDKKCNSHGRKQERHHRKKKDMEKTQREKGGRHGHHSGQLRSPKSVKNAGRVDKTKNKKLEKVLRRARNGRFASSSKTDKVTSSQSLIVKSSGTINTTSSLLPWQPKSPPPPPTSNSTSSSVATPPVSLPFSMDVNLSDKNLSQPLRLLTSLASMISKVSTPQSAVNGRESSSVQASAPVSVTLPSNMFTARTSSFVDPQPRKSMNTTIAIPAASASTKAGSVSGTIGRVEVTTLSPKQFTPIMKVLSPTSSASGSFTLTTTNSRAQVEPPKPVATIPQLPLSFLHPPKASPAVVSLATQSSSVVFSSPPIRTASPSQTRQPGQAVARPHVPFTPPVSALPSFPVVVTPLMLQTSSLSTTNQTQLPVVAPGTRPLSTLPPTKGVVASALPEWPLSTGPVQVHVSNSVTTVSSLVDLTSSNRSQSSTNALPPHSSLSKSTPSVVTATTRSSTSNQMPPLSMSDQTPDTPSSSSSVDAAQDDFLPLVASSPELVPSPATAPISFEADPSASVKVAPLSSETTSSASDEAAVSAITSSSSSSVAKLSVPEVTTTTSSPRSNVAPTTTTTLSQTLSESALATSTVTASSTTTAVTSTSGPPVVSTAQPQCVSGMVSPALISTSTAVSFCRSDPSPTVVDLNSSRSIPGTAQTVSTATVTTSTPSCIPKTPPISGPPPPVTSMCTTPIILPLRPENFKNILQELTRKTSQEGNVTTASSLSSIATSNIHANVAALQRSVFNSQRLARSAARNESNCVASTSESSVLVNPVFQALYMQAILRNASSILANRPTCSVTKGGNTSSSGMTKITTASAPIVGSSPTISLSTSTSHRDQLTSTTDTGMKSSTSAVLAPSSTMPSLNTPLTSISASVVSRPFSEVPETQNTIPVVSKKSFPLPKRPAPPLIAVADTEPQAKNPTASKHSSSSSTQTDSAASKTASTCTVVDLSQDSPSPSSSHATTKREVSFPGGVNPVDIVPVVQVYRDSKDIVIKWTLPSKYLHLQGGVETYEIYAHITNDGSGEVPPVSSPGRWTKVGTISSLKLPMAVTLSNILMTKKYSFSVRAVFDESSSVTSQFSKPSSLKV